MATRTLEIALKLNDRASKRLPQTTRNFQKSANTVTSAWKKVGVAIGGVALAARGLRAVVTISAEFEQKMADVRAISQGTQEEFLAMSDLAKQLGRTTVFTATQAAEGLELLTRAWFDATQSMTMLPETLNLAVAGNLELAQSTDIVANTLRSYALDATDAAHVTDVLAFAASKSNTDVAGLAEGLKTVGPVATQMGLSLEETVAALGRLADVGLKGERGGTVLRNALMRLLNPAAEVEQKMDRLGISIRNADGSFKNLDGILKSLRGAQLDAADAMHILGIRGGGLAKLMSLADDEMQNFTQSLEDVGGFAGQVAVDKMDTLTGSWKEFTSAMSGAAIEGGRTVTPFLRFLLDTLTDLTNATTDAGKATNDFLLGTGDNNFNLVMEYRKEIGQLVDTYRDLQHRSLLTATGIKNIGQALAETMQKFGVEGDSTQIHALLSRAELEGLIEAYPGLLEAIEGVRQKIQAVQETGDAVVGLTKEQITNIQGDLLDFFTDVSEMQETFNKKWEDEFAEFQQNQPAILLQNLDAQKAYYLEHNKDKVAVDLWYAEQKAKLDKREVDLFTKKYKLMHEVASSVVESMADAFSTFFYDILTGNLEHGAKAFEEFGKAVIKILVRMIAKLLVAVALMALAGMADTRGFAKISKLLKLLASDLSGGLLGGAASAAGGLASGGVQAAGGAATGIVSAAIGSRVHDTGPMLVHKDEEIIPRKQAEKMRQPVVINEYNMFNTIQAVDAASVMRNKEIIANQLMDSIARGHPVRRRF